MPTVTADEHGNYTVPNLDTGQWNVTPSKAGVTFSPTNRIVTITDADLTGVDFTASGGGGGSGSGGGGLDVGESFKFRFGF
jgi:hypothetical protein